MITTYNASGLAIFGKIPKNVLTSCTIFIESLTVSKRCAIGPLANCLKVDLIANA